MCWSKPANTPLVRHGVPMPMHRAMQLPPPPAPKGTFMTLYTNGMNLEKARKAQYLFDRSDLTGILLGGTRNNDSGMTAMSELFPREDHKIVFAGDLDGKGNFTLVSGKRHVDDETVYEWNDSHDGNGNNYWQAASFRCGDFRLVSAYISQAMKMDDALEVVHRYCSRTPSNNLIVSLFLHNGEHPRCERLLQNHLGPFGLQKAYSSRSERIYVKVAGRCRVEHEPFRGQPDEPLDESHPVTLIYVE